MRFSCLHVGIAIAFIVSTCGCAADSTPGPSAPSVVTVEPVPPPNNPPVSAAEEEPDATSSTELHDDGCRKLAETIPSSNANTVSVFMRAAAPVCLGAVAAADDAALEHAAREAADRGASAAVLYVDSSVVYARVIAVMDVLRRTGIENVVLAVAPKP
jgi:biopolymer transport protein ExbD